MVRSGTDYSQFELNGLQVLNRSDWHDSSGENQPKHGLDLIHDHGPDWHEFILKSELVRSVSRMVRSESEPADFFSKLCMGYISTV